MRDVDFLLGDQQPGPFERVEVVQPADAVVEHDEASRHKQRGILQRTRFVAAHQPPGDVPVRLAARIVFGVLFGG
jgi:hypothetical protein